MKSRRTQGSKKPKQKKGLKKGVVRRATKKGLKVRRRSVKRMRRGGAMTPEQREAFIRNAKWYSTAICSITFITYMTATPGTITLLMNSMLTLVNYILSALPELSVNGITQQMMAAKSLFFTLAEILGSTQRAILVSGLGAATMGGVAVGVASGAARNRALAGPTLNQQFQALVNGIVQGCETILEEALPQLVIGGAPVAAFLGALFKIPGTILSTACIYIDSLDIPVRVHAAAVARTREFKDRVRMKAGETAEAVKTYVERTGREAGAAVKRKGTELRRAATDGVRNAARNAKIAASRAKTAAQAGVVMGLDAVAAAGDSVTEAAGEIGRGILDRLQEYVGDGGGMGIHDAIQNLNAIRERFIEWDAQQVQGAAGGSVSFSLNTAEAKKNVAAGKISEPSYDMSFQRRTIEGPSDRIDIKSTLTPPPAMSLAMPPAMSLAMPPPPPPPPPQVLEATLNNTIMCKLTTKLFYADLKDKKQVKELIPLFLQLLLTHLSLLEIIDEGEDVPKLDFSKELTHSVAVESDELQDSFDDYITKEDFSEKAASEQLEKMADLSGFYDENDFTPEELTSVSPLIKMFLSPEDIKSLEGQ